MNIAEPATSITDFLIALEAACLGSVLLFQSDQLSVAFWGIALFLLAASAVAGGLYHAWNPDQGQPFRKKLPITIAFLMLITLLFMFYGGIYSSFTGNARIVAFAAIHILLFMALFKLPGFLGGQKRGKASRLGVGLILLVFLLILTAQIVFHGPEAGTWIVSGGIVCMAGAWIQQSQYQFHKHMNHNDICHLILMGGIYLLYRGGSLLLDK